MKRQLSFKFLGGLLVVVAVVAVVASEIHASQVKRNAGYLLAKAKEAETGQSPDPSVALKYLGHYIALRGDDAKARARFGVIVAKQARGLRDIEMAYLTLEHSFRDDPDLGKKLLEDVDLTQEVGEKAESPYLAAVADDMRNLRRRAAELAMDMRQFSDAKSHLEVALKERPGDARLLLLTGRCDESAGKTGPAAAAYESAIRAEPGRVEAYVRLAGLRARTGQRKEADKVMDDLARANPDSAQAQLESVRYYMGSNQLDSARRHLAAAQVGAGAGNKDVLLTTADFELASGNEAAARKALEAGLKAYPAEPRFYLVLAGLEFRAGHKVEAVADLHRAVETADKQPDVLWYIADLLIGSDDSAESKALAQDLIARLRAGKGDPSVLEFLEARLDLEAGKAVEAERKLQRCRVGLQRVPALVLRTELALAACYSRLAKPDLRLKAAEHAVELDAASVDARKALAESLLAVGNLDRAREVCQTLVARDPWVLLTIARIDLERNRLRPADRRDYTGAYAALDRVPAKLKQTVGFALTRADVLFAEGKSIGQAAKVAEARRIVEAVRDENPKDLGPWLRLAEFASDPGLDGNPRRGLEVLDQARATAGDRVLLRLARANLLVRQKAQPAALRELETGAEGFPAADRADLAAGLAAIHLQAGSAPDAVRLLRQVVALRPTDLGVLVRLFEAVVATGTPAELDDLIEKLRAAEGDDGAAWRLAEALKAVSELRRKNLDPADRPRLVRDARARLAEAGKRRPGWYWVPLIEAELEDGEGHTDAAIDLYVRAVRLGANRTGVIVRAATLLQARRRYAEARQLLDDVRRQTSELPVELEKVDAVSAARLGGGSDDVAGRIERAVPASSADYHDHLVRGTLLASIGKAEGAEAAFRRAVALAPMTADAWAGLVTYLAGAERTGDAKAEIANAVKALPAEARAQDLGPCYEAVGDRAEAEKSYLAARAANDTPEAARNLARFYLAGGETAKAEPVLHRLEGADAWNRRWARRSLAVLLAASGERDRGTEALKLLNANSTENPGDPDDLRARFLVEATRPGDRRPAIKDLEASFKRFPPTPGEEFILGRLYELDGDWPRASEHYTGLLTRAGGDNPTYIYHYAHALIRHDDLPAADRWLGKLKAKANESFVTSALAVDLGARLDAARGKSKEAAARVKDYARDSFKKDNNPVILRWGGLLLAELKALPDAEDLLRQFVAAAEAKTPAVVVILADFLARHQNRVGDALDLCSDALAKVSPELIARLTVGVVRLGEASEPQFARAEEIIRRAAQAQPTSTDIPVALADLRDAQGRYAEAEQMYRDMLRTGPRNTLALNNLAWLLAVHAGNGDESLRLIDQAIEIRGPDANLLDTRAVVLLTGGDPARAVTDLTAAVSQGASPERYFHLAQAYLKQGNKTEALRAMRKARELNLSPKDLHKLELSGYKTLLGLVGGKE
jgi:tetratricopeptide (TPR) repeat protein